MLSEQQWESIRVKAKEAWENEPLNSERRKGISIIHGRIVIIEDSNKKFLGEYPSQEYLKAAEFIGVNRYFISRFLNSNKLLDSRVGPVFLTDK